MEEKKIRRIAVLTSGGDAPGMNAVVRAVVRTACANGIQADGAQRGWFAAARRHNAVYCPLPGNDDGGRTAASGEQLQIFGH